MKNLIVRLILVLVVIPSVSKAAESQPIDHFVFLVHGLGGNVESFGSMQEALTKHLNETPSMGNVAVASFGYLTFREYGKSEEFAELFGDFIMKTVNGLSPERYVAHPNYKISVVAHSQGGLVTTTLFYRSLQNRPYYDPEIARRMTNVITLGTPFWGSKVATYAVQNPWKFDKFQGLANDFLADVGKVGSLQIKELALGSSVVQRYRRNMMEMGPDAVNSIYDRVRVLNVAGNANLKRITQENTTLLKPKSKAKQVLSNYFSGKIDTVFGLTEYEADMLVSIPSATLNTMTVQKLNTDYEMGESTMPWEFNTFDKADRLLVRTVHASPKAEDVYDIVYTPKHCIEDENCDHDTYNYVLNYLRGYSLQDIKNLRAGSQDGASLGFDNVIGDDKVKMQNFGGFTLGVNVRLPVGKENMRRSVRITVTPARTSEANAPELLVSLKDETLSKVRYDKSSTYPDSMIEWRTGHFKYTEDESIDTPNRRNGGLVRIQICASGMRTRVVYAPVKPTLSTFVDVQLAEMTPEEARQLLLRH